MVMGQNPGRIVVPPVSSGQFTSVLIEFDPSPYVENNLAPATRNHAALVPWSSAQLEQEMPYFHHLGVSRKWWID